MGLVLLAFVSVAVLTLLYHSASSNTASPPRVAGTHADAFVHGSRPAVGPTEEIGEVVEDGGASVPLPRLRPDPVMWSKLPRDEHITRLLRDLVSIPTLTSRPDAFEIFVDYVERYFAHTPWQMKRWPADGKTRRSTNKAFGLHAEPAPLAYLHSPAAGASAWRPKVLIIVHADVVPASTISQFVMTGPDSNGVVRGRGVGDMKGSIAAVMHTLRAAPRPADLDVALLITADEEIGGLDGARFAFLDDEGPKIRADVAILNDSGAGFQLAVLEKGIMQLELEAVADGGHAAYPWRVDNPIDALMQDLAMLQSKRVGDLPDEYFAAAGQQRTGELVFDNSEQPWHTTMSVTSIHAGSDSLTGLNQIPARAVAHVDIRFTEQWSAEDLLAWITSLPLASTVSPVTVVTGFSMRSDSAYIKTAQSIIARRRGGAAVELVRGHGASDGHYATDVDVPAVMFSPVIGGSHSADEWLQLSSLSTLGDIIADMLLQWGKVAPS